MPAQLYEQHHRMSAESPGTSFAYGVHTPTAPTIQLRQRSSEASSFLVESDLARLSNDIDELQDHVFMAIDKSMTGTVGCAYYIARHELLCCIQDISNAETEVFETLKLDIQPTTVLASMRVDVDSCHARAGRLSSLANDGALVELCKSRLTKISDEGHLLPPYETVIRPASDFRYDAAIEKLSSLVKSDLKTRPRFLVPGTDLHVKGTPVLEELGLVDHQGRLLSIGSSLDLDNRVSIGCVGAVISYLQRRKASDYLQHDPDGEIAYRISAMEMVAFTDTMLLDVDTLSSLQIIQSEKHPSIASQDPNASRSKESLSVYGLFHTYAKTPQGRARLRQMFLRPSLCRKTISQRHDFISTFLQADNRPLCHALSKSLGGIRNMRLTLTSLRKGIERGSLAAGTIRSGVWAALLEFCYHAIDITEMFREVNGHDKQDILGRIRKQLDKPRLQRLGKTIHDVIDLNESFEHARTVIKRGVDDDLDKVKDAYNMMEEILADIAREITNTMPVQIQKRLDVVFLPQLGFHLAVPLDDTTKQPVWTGLGQWDQRFASENHTYFKDDKMRDMDQRWGDLYAKICDTEIEISHELAQRVLDQENWLLQASEACGDLDSLLALTHGALQYDLTRPIIVEENIIDIKKGWHILQKLMVSSFVSNDALLAGGDEQDGMNRGPSMILLTGPNYSGKSVYKKQVALIVYLAQIGSFVPATAASLGITDKILTRINTSETVSKLQSAFVIDLQQISRALKSCTSQSLILIDEFGKGTDPCDGAGLASAIYIFLLKLGTESPKVLTSTHFHEIFDLTEFERFQNLALKHMEVYLHESEDEKPIQATAEAIYLYSLRRGRSTLSYGNQCATMNGIPGRVVERAMLLADLLTQGEDLVTTCTSLSPDELEELEDAENICRSFLDHEFVDDSADVRKTLRKICGTATEEVLRGSAVHTDQ